MCCGSCREAVADVAAVFGTCFGLEFLLMLLLAELRRGVFYWHALCAKQTVCDGSFIIVGISHVAGPYEEVTGNLEHVVLGAGLLSLKCLLLLRHIKRTS